MIYLEFDFPPSANRIWRMNHKGKVHRAPKYVEWLERAGWQIIQQRQGGITGPYKLTVQMVRPDNRKRDLDNCIKPISDLLKSVGVIADDSDAEMISLRWVTSGAPVSVQVEKAGKE